MNSNDIMQSLGLSRDHKGDVMHSPPNDTAGLGH